MAALTRLGVGGSAAAYKFEPAAVIILDATKGVVTASGAVGTLVPAGADDATKGNLSITAMPAAAILHASRTTKATIYVVGKSATLIDGAPEILDAAPGSVTIGGKAALLYGDIINAISGSVIISGKAASVEWYVLDAASGDISIVAAPAWANEQAEILEAVKASLSISGNQAIMADSKIIILPRSRMLIITK